MTDPEQTTRHAGLEASPSARRKTATNRRTWLLAGAGICATTFGAGAWWMDNRGSSAAQPTSTRESLGGEFWGLSLPSPGGEALALESLRGKPALVNFWATWCAPCVAEMPMIDAFYREHAVDGWRVVGIAVDLADSVDKFLARTPVSYPIGIAGLEGTQLVQTLGNAAGGLPFSVVLHGDGTVLDRKLGQIEPTDLSRWARDALHN